MKRQKGLGIRRPFINKRNRLMLKNKKRKTKSSGVTRPFINKRNRLMLGNKKQKGGLFGELLEMIFKR